MFHVQEVNIYDSYIPYGSKRKFYKLLISTMIPA